MILVILLALCLVGVVAVLMVGVVAMGRGGEFNRKYGNTLMRARVGLQALALILLAALFFTSQPG
jgi:NADH:ubiquinone oxidoreductase subunit 6 (subunit J)